MDISCRPHGRYYDMVYRFVVSAIEREITRLGAIAGRAFKFPTEAGAEHSLWHLPVILYGPTCAQTSSEINFLKRCDPSFPVEKAQAVSTVLISTTAEQILKRIVAACDPIIRGSRRRWPPIRHPRNAYVSGQPFSFQSGGAVLV